MKFSIFFSIDKTSKSIKLVHKGSKAIGYIQTIGQIKLIKAAADSIQFHTACILKYLKPSWRQHTNAFGEDYRF